MRIRMNDWYVDYYAFVGLIARASTVQAGGASSLGGTNAIGLGAYAPRLRAGT